jgi:ubiquinone/menaquinone biosynthesis C-methylase UbiE
MLDTPVVLSIFNRPDLTRLVFQAIARARPKRLFVLADGPRSPEEAALCARTRAVTERVDWDCDVKTNFSEVNLGCRQRCASGFDWVFAQVDSAIFLEDDCVPDPTFFRFCEVMLEHYRDDTRIMMITGSNYLGSWKADRQSYHFSYFGSPWGWASWRRAWKFYDVTMKLWGDQEIKARIRDVLADEECFAFQAWRFDLLSANLADRHSWDLPWSFARLMQSGLTVVPAVNLISNRGCLGGDTAPPPTHPVANLPTEPMSFPIRFHPFVSVDRLYDVLHIRRIAGRDPISSEPRAGGGHHIRSPLKRMTKAILRTLAPDATMPYRVAKRLEQKQRQLRLVASNTVRRLKGAPDGLPIPPARLVSLVQGTENVQEFLTDGRDTALEVMRVLTANGVEIGKLRTILDFGCGCGRVLRHVHAITGAQLYGTDYNPQAIDWCRRKLTFAQFEVNGLAPPLLYEKEQFDLIYALSVFTHLPESLQLAWMVELSRVLKPHGYMLMTTHGECFLPHMREEEQKSFRSGRLVVREAGSAGSNPFFTAHPFEYMKTHLPPDLAIVGFVPETRRKGEPPSRLCWQDGYVLAKRSG